MSTQSTALQKRSDELQLKWDVYVASPEFEPFVEFAVCISSFSEFLQGMGLSGLHKAVHSLEQQALALFDDADKRQIRLSTLQSLNLQIEALSQRVTQFIGTNSRPLAHRRTGHETDSASDLLSTHRIWFISDSASPWRPLTAQLAYFGIQAEVHPWQSIPANTVEPAILLLDTRDMALEQSSEHIQTLRSRFSASKLIVQNFPTDFNSLKAALRAGCDLCLAQDTPQAVVLAKIIELCCHEEEPPFRVLVVEDSMTASQSIQRTLKQNGIEPFAVTNPAEVLNGLRRFQPDLVLMDMYMPDCTGVEATRVIRQHSEFLSIPVIYLSGEGDMALQVDALRLGGEHFLTKPFNPVVLNAVVKSKIERYRALRRSMQHDGLTGLLNHRTIKDRLTAAIKNAELSNSLLAVAMIDIDHFKAVNDNYGHPIGDQVIRSLAWLLKQRLRNSDLVGRYGGEEFLVILPDSDTALAYDILERIRRDFAVIQHPFSDSWFETTFSTGVSGYPVTTCPEALIKDADKALYEAKQGGRNCVVTHG